MANLDRTPCRYSGGKITGSVLKRTRQGQGNRQRANIQKKSRVSNHQSEDSSEIKEQVVVPENRSQEAGEDNSSQSQAEDLDNAQVKQKDYKNHRLKTKVKPGDLVCVLMPTGHQSLMQWKGKFRVIRQVRGNCFIIDVHGKERIYHASMLTKCINRAHVEPVVRLGVYSSLGKLQTKQGYPR